MSEGPSIFGTFSRYINSSRKRTFVREIFDGAILCAILLRDCGAEFRWYNPTCLLLFSPASENNISMCLLLLTITYTFWFLFCFDVKSIFLLTFFLWKTLEIYYVTVVQNFADITLPSSFLFFLFSWRP